MINSDLIPQDIYTIIDTLNKAGFEAYLVGGAVRDLLVGKRPKDFDISTNANPYQIKKLFPKRAFVIGRRFKIIHLHFEKRIYEISTFRRTPSKTKKGFRGKKDKILWRDNAWGTLEQDAPRRDFSINALYYNPITDQLKDPVNALKDLEKGVIRCLGVAKKRFEEDPIRMLRAIKLVAEYGFELSNDIAKAIEQNKNLLLNVPLRRRFEEVVKLTKKPYLSRYLQCLYQYKLLSFILPQIPSKQFETYKFLAQYYDDEFERQVYSKSYILALLCFPFIHYALVKNNSWSQSWLKDKNMEKTLSSLIAKFYKPYVLLKRHNLQIREILISAQRLMTTKKYPQIRQWHKAKRLQKAIESLA